MTSPVVPKPLAVVCRHAGLTIHALEHPAQRGDALPIVWLHGWLDNAASFTPLIPLLENAGRSIAIDFPGHGLSSWLSPTQPYLLWESPFIIKEFVNTVLGPDQPYILAGHSMGAAIAPLLAGIDSDGDQPGGCRGLLLLDGCGPFYATDDIRERLMLYKDGLKRVRAHRSPHTYGSVAEAVAARLHQGDLTESSAQLIVERGLRPKGAGYVFRHDPKLRLPTAHRFGKAQVESFFKHIHCPVLLLLASKGLLDRDEVATRAAHVRDWQQGVVAGGHHFHMDAADLTAAAVDPWLATLAKQ